ncbi:MAG TPA: extracellular solute-binding protein [Phycisphaerales bacterium]|nr:extracellular solute-binding protein [Phycisphaerales bacterium]
MKTNKKLTLGFLAIAVIAVCVIMAGGPKGANAKSEVTIPILQHQKVETVENKSLGSEQQVLRLLIWEGYAPTKYVEEFEKQIEAKYGRKVKLQISFVEGGDDFYNPVRSKKADLITVGAELIHAEQFNYITNKLILPLDLENIPNHKHVISALRKADYLLSNGNTYGVPICQGPYGLAYNTEKFEKEPDTWKVLWDPKYKGKYIIGGKESQYNIGTTALAFGYPSELISSYDALNNRNFTEKLRQLTTNAHSFWIGQDTADDLSGLSLAAVWGDSLGALKKRGEIWKIAEPKEGTLCWVDNYAITWALADKPFLKKVAEEWINKLLEPDYQVDYIVREITLGPITTNIGDRLTAEEKKQLNIGVANVKSSRIPPSPCSRRDLNGLRIMWNEAMKGIVVEKEK